VNDDQSLVAAYSRSREPRVYFRGRLLIDRHFNRVSNPVGCGDADRREQVALVFDRVPGAERARTPDPSCVHPAASDHLVADPLSCAAQPGQQRGARTAVKIDRQVEPFSAKRSAQPKVGGESPHAADSRRNDHVVDMRIVANDRRCVRLDDVRNVGVRVVLADGAHGGSGEDHITDLAKPN